MPSVSQHSRRRLRVGVMFRHVGNGGVEVWTETMGRYGFDHYAVWSDRRNVPEGCDEHLDGLMIHSGNDADWIAWRDSNDAIVLWSHDKILPRLQGYTGRIVLMAQGAADWTRQWVAPCSPFADLRIAVSEPAADVFPRHHRDSVRVIWNCADLRRLETDRTRADVRAELDLADDQIAVAYIGRWSPEKHAEAVAEAVAALPQAVAVYKCPTYTLAIDGIMEHVKDGRFRLSPGSVAEAFRAADVFVLASPAEGNSLAIMEAWAAGVPVVCTPVGGVPEIERAHGRMTVSIPVNASGSMIAAAIVEAMHRRESLIAAGRRFTETWTAVEMAAAWDRAISYLPDVPNTRFVSPFTGDSNARSEHSRGHCAHPAPGG